MGFGGGLVFSFLLQLGLCGGMPATPAISDLEDIKDLEATHYNPNGSINSSMDNIYGNMQNPPVVYNPEKDVMRPGESSRKSKKSRR